MTRYTNRTYRTQDQWCKVTRDNKERTFTFAKGSKGNVQAYTIETLSFKWVANWAEAEARATSMMQF